MIKIVKRQIKVRDKWLENWTSGIIQLDCQDLKGRVRRIESYG